MHTLVISKSFPSGRAHKRFAKGGGPFRVIVGMHALLSILNLIMC